MYLINSITKSGDDYVIVISWKSWSKTLIDYEGISLKYYFAPEPVNTDLLVGKIKKIIISASSGKFIILD